jgi:hypothetical protein
LRLNVCRTLASILILLGARVGSLEAGPARPAPPLPAPTGTVVNVSNNSQLQSAVSSLTSNKTIVLAAGTYTLSSTLYVNGTFSNVAIRGATGNADDVVLVGQGMTGAAGNVPYGIWVGGNVQKITIADLTIRDVFYHQINFNDGTQSPLVHNVHLINAGEQFIKSNPNASGTAGVNNGVVEYSVFEYSTTAPTDYTNGVDVHTGQNWIIANNLFKNIRTATGALAGPAILMWNNSSGSIAEGNTFINCQREISFGLIERTPNDHVGGIIRNNFIYRSPGIGGDAGILIGDSANTSVLHNTIVLSGTYPNAIEYRFSGSTGAVIANNLSDGGIFARDGASGSTSGNVTNATTSLFVSASTGDLHLKSTATSVIDKAASVANCPDDWDGDSRPQGSARDVGADEFGSTTTTSPRPPTNVRIIS